MRVQVEATPAAVKSAAGSYAKAARAALGLGTGRLPAKGTRGRLQYDSARQAFTRYDKGVRSTNTAAARRLLQQAASALSIGATADRVRGLRGTCQAVMRARVVIDSPGGGDDSRVRTMPAGGRQRVPDPHNPYGPRDNSQWVDAFAAGDVDEAGELFAAAFVTAYFGGIGGQVVDVDWITIEREGTL